MKNRESHKSNRVDSIYVFLMVISVAIGLATTVVVMAKNRVESGTRAGAEHCAPNHETCQTAEEKVEGGRA